jgi:hypothetical protein
MKAKDLLLVFIIVFVVNAASAYLITDHFMSDIDERFLQSPPVVVVDFAQMAMGYPEGANPEELEALMMKTNNAVLTLKDAGYLVLDAAAVISAPDDIYLPEDLVK